MSVLNGRVAVITGAGRGIGREHALLFAELGAKVVVNDLADSSGGSSPAKEVVDLIHERGGAAIAHLGSASNWTSAREMIDMAVETFGELDILVNNAGIIRDRMLVNMSESEWDAVIDVHLKGHFAPLHHAAKYWRDQAKNGEMPRASVINTASTSGLKGNPGQLNYAAAKAGIASMTQVAARELERYGVRVNAIAPVARTRMTLATPGLQEKLAVVEGFDKFAPENISPMVAWLGQADCPISGQVFTVFGEKITWQSGWADQKVFEGDGRWTPESLSLALSGLPHGTAYFAATV